MQLMNLGGEFIRFAARKSTIERTNIFGCLCFRRWLLRPGNPPSNVPTYSAACA